jgi:cysteine desulfurase / selenocysteine lyase
MTPTPTAEAAARSYDEFCAETRARITEILPAALKDALDHGVPWRVIDVREPGEFAEGHIGGSINIPRGALEKSVAGIARPIDRIALYCQTGKRSALAAETLRRMGYIEVASVAGGIEAWKSGSLAVTVNARADSQHGAVNHADWASIRADFGITGRVVRTASGIDRTLVYLDHAASTHPPSTVVRAYAQFLEREYANVHRATYALARAATDRFDSAFHTCAEFVGGNLTEGCVVFTANTTHGCDLVAHAVAHLPGKVMVTDLEHHSNDLTYRRRGDVVRARVTTEGRLDLGHVEELFKRERIKLLSVCGAANVTGWMPPLGRLARLAHEHGALIAVDAAQLVAHVPIDVRAGDPAESIDFLITAGHKAYAPFGIGFVYAKRAALDAAEPYMPGGGTASTVTESGVDFLTSPDRHQGGTPNIAGAIAFAEMLRYLSAVGMRRVREHELELMRIAWPALKAMDRMTLYGPDALDERVGIITFNVDGVNDMLTAAVLGEEFGVAVRNGRFCAHVHTANLMRTQGGYTLTADTPPSAVRASFGIYNDRNDVERLLEAIRAVHDHKWIGTYRQRSSGMVEAERQWGGRCADAWMEGG